MGYLCIVQREQNNTNLQSPKGTNKMETMFTTAAEAVALVKPNTRLATLIAELQAEGHDVELALFAATETDQDVTAEGYDWDEAEFTTEDGTLLSAVGSNVADATHIGVIVTGQYNFTASGYDLWIEQTEKGGIYGYSAAFFAL